MAKRKPLLERFESNVIKTPGCWLWTAGTGHFGYGIMRAENRQQTAAHRIAYALFKGPIPEGKFILHSCDVPNCVNPDHLRAGTAFENARDKDERHRYRNPAGPECTHAKFTAEQVRAIRADSRDFKTLAEVYAVHPSTMKAIVERRRYRNV